VFRVLGADRAVAWTPPQIGDLVARKAARLDVLERARSILFPGAADAVHRAAATVPIAIASGALGAEIRRLLTRENLISCFTAIVAAEDTQASKPAPDPYLHALTLLKAAMGEPFAAAHCVAIEDSQWGLQSARAAGLRTVGITHTYAAGQLFDADLVLESLDELDMGELGRLCSG
jgi:beta-phosphoglucomutase